ncbi:MAG: hypothetical protein K8I29_12145 [Alphaproteobacteria bacterium]|uniref:Uncharacterized protein n=1 Tax=Candidatus Nitrobium versatile TaxID=2884831 RepID=A0A953M1N3_9BACT|nr:hypothetical protein [Candidatus Nitrobium versatile]
MDREMIKRVFLFVALCIIFPLFSVHAAVSAGSQLKTLFISESYGVSAGSTAWKSAETYLTKKMNATFSLGAGGISQTSFSSASSAISTLETALSPQLNSYIGNIASHLSSEGYAFARVDWLYSFYDSGDSNALKKAYFPLIIYPDGRVRNMGMRVITSTPSILYYIYMSKGTEEDLPSDWTYEDGGILYKYVLDQDFAVISSSQVDTAGRYDPPKTPEGDSTIDPDSGLKLLISEVVKGEMTNKSALYALIDYSRRITPLWDCDSEGNCIARIKVESETREYAKMCGKPPTYRNTGKTGYTLQYQSERYFVSTDGSYTMTASSTGETVAPKEDPFDWLMDVEEEPSYEQVIDPFKGLTLYDFTNDTFNNLPCNYYLYAGGQCSQAPLLKTIETFTMGGSVGWDPTTYYNYSRCGVPAWNLSIAGTTLSMTMWVPGLSEFSQDGTVDYYYDDSSGCYRNCPSDWEGDTSKCTLGWTYSAGSITLPANMAHSGSASSTLPQDGQLLTAYTFSGSGNQLRVSAAVGSGSTVVLGTFSFGDATVSGSVTFPAGFASPANFMLTPQGNYLNIYDGNGVYRGRIEFIC